MVMNKIFFSLIMSVLNSSLNSVQNNRSIKIKNKKVSEFSERSDSPRMATKRALNSVTKKVIHGIRDVFFTGRYKAHIYMQFCQQRVAGA